MEMIRDMAILLCGIFIVVAVVEAILPQKSMSFIMRWAVLLFVVAMLTRPMEFDFEDMMQGFETPDDQNIELSQQQLLQETEYYLSQQMLSTFEAEGIAVEDVRVALEQSDTSVHLQAVYIKGEQISDRLRINSIAEAVLQTAPNVIYE